MRNLSFLSVALCGLGLAACSDPLTKTEARQAWPATNSTLEGGRVNNSGALTALDPLSIGVEAPCPEDGTMEWKVSLSDLGVNEFGFTVEFNDCNSDGLVIDGEIDYALSLTTDATNTTFAWHWEGDLSYEGRVEGDCEYDMTGRLSVTTGTPGDPTSVDLEYSGTLCGYDAEALLQVTN